MKNTEPISFHKVARMTCLALIASKGLSACSHSPETIQGGAEVLGELTGLDSENLASAATGITNGAAVIDNGMTTAANAGLEAAVNVGAFVSGNTGKEENISIASVLIFHHKSRLVIVLLRLRYIVA